MSKRFSGPARPFPAPPLRRFALLAALVAALALFQLVFGLRLLSAGDAYWSNPHGDMSQMLAGELAGLRAPWSLPILTPDTLLAPDRVSLVYTDSIPWLTALLKLLHLGRTFSLLGTFLFLAWLAQPAAMYALLRACGVRRASTLLAGALLALLVPAWLGRQVGHIALSGHAFEIAALALAVRSIRGGLDRAGLAGFFALGVAAVGVHAYHVPPVTLMFVTALAADILQRRPDAGKHLLRAGPAFLVALLATAWACGYFVGRGSSGGVSVLGVYEMNMIAPVLPQGSALAGQKWDGDWFTHVFDPTGGQVFEGYNYLGAGVLLLLLVAVGLLLRERARPVGWAAEPRTTPLGHHVPGGWPRRWGPLAAALGLLTLYAFGARPYLGTFHILTVPLPDRPWMEPFALFRCHGRFFWTVGYALLAGALTVIDRVAGARARYAMLIVTVLLQAADMSQMLGGLRDRFSRPDASRLPPALLGPAFRGRDVRIYPGYFCTTSWMNQLLARQLSLVTERQDATINAAETAREPFGSCTRPPPVDALVDAVPGDRRITVLMGDDGGASAATDLFSRRSDCFAYTSIWMCGRDLAGVAGLSAISGRQLIKATHLDQSLTLDGLRPRPELLSGWSAPEPTGVWSQAPRAVLRLAHPELPPGAFLTVTVEALGYQPPGRGPQRAEVSVAGRRLAEWQLEGGGYRHQQIVVPSELLPSGRPVDVVLDLPDSLSPDEVLPGSGDPRRLGVGMRRITLAH